MSQRLQSIFFFLSALLFALLFFLPLAEYHGEQNILVFNVFGIETQTPGAEVPWQKTFSLPVLILALVLGMSGCRYRVTKVGNTDKVVPDKGGVKAAKYEKKRKDLDLKKTAKSLLEKNKPISPTNTAHQPKS